MKIKDLPQLEMILEQKDNEISELQEKVKKLERNIEVSLDTWQLPKYIPCDDFRKDLPVPRLEMIAETVDYYGSKWTYGIVRQAHKGHREKWDSEKYVLIPFSQTTTSSNDLTKFDRIERPFRDSTHILYDSVSLGLPAFITYPDKKMIERFEVNEQVKEQFQEEKPNV